MKIKVRAPSLERLYEHLLSGNQESGSVNKLVNNAIEEAGVGIARGIERRARRISRLDRKELRRFERRLAKRWRRGLNLFASSLVHARDVGAQFNDQYRAEASVQNDFLFDALTQLQARACLTAREVLTLLRAGLPAGAFARWRTLHEIAVAGYLVAEGGNPVAERFLLHDIVENAKDAVAYQEHCAALGYEPLSDEELVAMQSQRSAIVDRFGKPFNEPNGWAIPLFPEKTKLQFRDLETKSGLGHMRPWYRFTSHSTHSGSKGTAMNAITRGNGTILLAGPTNAGLADVGHGALISLSQITITLILQGRPLGEEDFERIANARALLELCDIVGEEFISAHRQLEADENAFQSRAAPGVK